MSDLNLYLKKLATLTLVFGSQAKKSGAFNLVSRLTVGDCFLQYRFLGRIIARALFDGPHFAGYMLNWHVAFRGRESIDEKYYRNLSSLKTQCSK